MAVNSRIELRSEEIQKDPYPTYAYMRENEPVCVLADGQYALTRDEDVRNALSDSETFSSAIEIISAPDWLDPEYRRSMFILSKDPPDHTKYRAIANKQFNAGVIKNLLPLMESTATGLISRLKEKKAVEFVTEFAYPYVGEIIGKINVSGENPPLDDTKANLELRELNTPERPSEEHIRALEAEIAKQNRYYDAILRDRKSNPKEDLATVLVQAEVDGEALSQNEMRDALDLFTAAGFHTTAQLLASAMLYLARYPDLRRQLAEEPSLIPDFVEELLRFDGPTHRVLRKATRDVVLHGVRIPRGAIVSVIISAANHDPSVFSNPERFDISRKNNRKHLQFSGGAHVCIGSALARAEMRVALEIILRTVENITCLPEYEPQYTGTMTTRGLRQLLVRFD